MTGVRCVGCGRPAEACSGCRREYDPPRFCAACGLRLTVRLTPRTTSARCRDHGPVDPETGTPSQVQGAAQV